MWGKLTFFAASAVSTATVVGISRRTSAPQSIKINNTVPATTFIIRRKTLPLWL